MLVVSSSASGAFDQVHCLIITRGQMDFGHFAGGIWTDGTQRDGVLSGGTLQVSGAGRRCWHGLLLQGFEDVVLAATAVEAEAEHQQKQDINHQVPCTHKSITMDGVQLCCSASGFGRRY